VLAKLKEEMAKLATIEAQCSQRSHNQKFIHRKGWPQTNFLFVCTQVTGGRPPIYKSGS